MSNPLLDKYNKIHSPKKEEPKEEAPKNNSKIDLVFDPLKEKYLSEEKVKEYKKAIASLNPPTISSKLQSNRLNIELLEIARRIERDQAQVTDINVDYSYYPSNKRTVSLRVEVYDGP